MLALAPIAWAALAAVLALGGSFAWAWSILEGIEICDPACPLRPARGMRLAATLIAMIASLAAASQAWRTAVAYDTTVGASVSLESVPSGPHRGPVAKS